MLPPFKTHLTENQLRSSSRYSVKNVRKEVTFSGEDIVLAFQIMKTPLILTESRPPQTDSDGETTRVSRFSQFEDKEEEQITDQNSLEDEISEKQQR